ncbi:MAG TPA: penicillin-binding protein 2 [Rhizomicrobium sp.]|jgi:cell division protein FtsI (penicillin-binding protein 3)
MSDAAIHQRRIVIAAGFCVMAFSLIGVKLVDVAVLKGSVTHAVAAAPEKLETLRADITDRNGELLARDLPTSDLYVTPHAFDDKGEAARDLADTLGLDAAKLAKQFSGKHAYLLVARQLSEDQVARVNALGLPGMDFEPSSKRSYPRGLAVQQIVGLTDNGDAGVNGIESGIDARLRQGGVVALSIDMRIQYALMHELAEAKTNYNALAAGGIVMDVNTGEILAMTSLPDSGPPDDKGLLPGRNRMVRDTYELGSVFKIFAFTLAMQDHTTRLDESFPIGAGFKLGRYTIHDAERMPATMMAKDILAQSSNAGTAQIALRSGPTRQYEFLKSMGLLRAPRTELAETAWPNYPHYPQNWGQTETATIGFGHGIQVSPLAFAAAASTVVNGGRKVVPTFLKHPDDARGEQLISPETSATMRGLLRYVVTDGTGKQAEVPGYMVGGKTGSAEKAVNHRYVAHKLLTSFCAVFPIDNPRYLVFVLLDEPHGAKAEGVMALAGHTAAPLAGRVIARIAPMLQMPVAQLPPAPAVPAKGKS